MENVVIHTENLNKTFGRFIAVNNISFKVGKGEIFGFLGANGAGKTTAIKMLCGLLTPTSGKATVAGFDVFNQSESIKKTIGYMSQKFSLYGDLTVWDNIKLYAGIYGLTNKEIKDRGEELINALDITEFADKLVVGLPLGFKQKLAFSVALIHNPQLVFLDEPTGGVDPVTRRQFWEMIYQASERGTTVFVTTHYMDEAEYCDRVLIMVDGAIKALDTPAVLKKTYNVASMDEVFLYLARDVVEK